MGRSGRNSAGVMAVLLAAAAAHAQPGAEKQRDARESSAQRDAKESSARQDTESFEVMIRPGYGSAGAKSPVVGSPGRGGIFGGRAEPYGGGFVGEISAGNRFLPPASVGLYGQMRSSSADEPNDGTKDLSRWAWGAGFYGRFYLAMLHPNLDPYLQIGVGYARDTQKWKGPVQPYGFPFFVEGDWELEHEGVVLPLGIGIGYRPIPSLSVGPSFRYDIVLPASGRADARPSPFNPDDESRGEAEGYGVWSAGLDLKLTLSS